MGATGGKSRMELMTDLKGKNKYIEDGETHPPSTATSATAKSATASTAVAATTTTAHTPYAIYEQQRNEVKKRFFPSFSVV